MYGEIISALKDRQSQLGHSALKQMPTDVDLKFHFGVQVGKYQGLQQALDDIDRIIQDIEKRTDRL